MRASGAVRGLRSTRPSAVSGSSVSESHQGAGGLFPAHGERPPRVWSLISKVTPPLTEQTSKPEASTGRTNIILAHVHSQTRKLRHRSLSNLPRDPQ